MLKMFFLLLAYDVKLQKYFEKTFKGVLPQVNNV